MANNSWVVIGVSLLVCIIGSPVQGQNAACKANPSTKPDTLGEGTTCRIVLTREKSPWDRYDIRWFYEGAVVKASKEGVLLAASVHSGVGKEQLPPILHSAAQWIPLHYSFPLYLLPPKNVGCARNELGGKEVWIPGTQIATVELLEESRSD